MKRLFALILTLTLALSLAGCGSAGSSDGAGESGTSGEESGDPIRVACILSGPISDMSWNYTAHQGLLKMEAMGAEIAYQENVENSALPDCINTYASDGYDMIILSTNSYVRPPCPSRRTILTPRLLSSTGRQRRAMSPVIRSLTRTRALCRASSAPR